MQSIPARGTLCHFMDSPAISFEILRLPLKKNPHLILILSGRHAADFSVKNNFIPCNYISWKKPFGFADLDIINKISFKKRLK